MIMVVLYLLEITLVVMVLMILWNSLKAVLLTVANKEHQKLIGTAGTTLMKQSYIWIMCICFGRRSRTDVTTWCTSTPPWPATGPCPRCLTVRQKTETTTYFVMVFPILRMLFKSPKMFIFIDV